MFFSFCFSRRTAVAKVHFSIHVGLSTGLRAGGLLKRFSLLGASGQSPAPDRWKAGYHEGDETTAAKNSQPVR